MSLVLMLEEALRTADSSQKSSRWVGWSGCVLRAQNGHNQRAEFGEGARPVLQDLGITGSPGLDTIPPNTQFGKQV